MTKPVSPSEPSSVVTNTCFEKAPSSACRMTYLALRPPMMVVSSLPASARPLARGNSTAVPAPPPTQAIRPTFSISVGMPRGPAMSERNPPAGTATISRVLMPTAWMIRVMVPAAGSSSAMVSGIRSRPWPARTMTNWPGLRARATRGASMTMRCSCGAISSLLTTRNIRFPPFVLIPLDPRPGWLETGGLGRFATMPARTPPGQLVQRPGFRREPGAWTGQTGS